MKKILLSFVAVMALSLGVFAQWTEQATGFSDASRGIRWISAVDDQVVWAAAYDGSGGAAACQDMTITNNGGDLWTPHTIPGVTNLDIAMISAVSSTKAWAALFPPAATTTGQGIYQSTNGGVTWTRQATATFSNGASFVNIVHFFDPILGFCQGDPINGDFEIYTTDDGGTTWTLVPGANIPNPVSGEYGVIGYYAAVGDIVWFGTNKGRVFKSIDNGHNWTVSSITGWGAKYVQPFFRDEMNGICQDKSQASTGAMVRTTDGGATWTPIVTTGQVFTNDMAYVPGTDETWISTGAATDFTGVTYSFNDATAWSDMAATLGTQFLATDWIDNETGWAGGFNLDATSGGMFKFNSLLEKPDFTAPVTNVAIGGSVAFSITAGAHSTSTVSWTFAGGTPATSSSRTPTVVYNTSGTYNVTLKVTNSWGIETTVKQNFVYVGGVGVDEKAQTAVSVYPNPVNGLLNIESNVNMQEVSLLNMTGQVVFNTKTDANSLQINTSDLSSGVYSLQIKSGDKMTNKKIVVK